MAYLKGQPFKPQFTDPSTGSLMASGTIEFYLDGTSTPTPYYTNSSGTSGGTSLTLNSGGKPDTDIYFDTAITYKIVVKGSAGTILDTITDFRVIGDDVITSDTDNTGSVALFVAASHAGEAKYIQSYYGSWGGTAAGPKGGHWVHKTGATNSSPTVGSPVAVSTIGTGTQAGYYWDADGNEWKLSKDNQKIDLFMFGAKADGSIDDTTSIQDGLDFTHNNATGIIYAKAGTYVTGTINWPGNNITLQGSGSGYSYNSAATTRTTFQAKAATTIMFDLVQTGLAEDRTGNVICDVDINGNSIATIGVDMAGSNILERCRVRGCSTTGVSLNNFTNGCRIVRCGLNQNSGWGLQATGVSATTYSVSECNISLNTSGGVDLQTGVLVGFKNTVIESNVGPGLRIYKPNTHTNAFEGYYFDNCWLEDNASASPNFVLVIDAGTSTPTAGPQRVRFMQCRFTASAVTRKYANINVGKWIEFVNCQFDNSTQTDAVTIGSNGHNVSFINSGDNTGSTGLTATQLDNAIAGGSNCWWYDVETKRAVGGASPAAAFQNSWVNYGAGFTPASYWFDKDGKVCIEGSIKSGTTGVAAFKLPAGYRPSTQKAFAVDGNGAHSLVYVTPSGEVQINSGSATFQSLNGITFDRQ